VVDAESDNRSRGIEALSFLAGGQGQWPQDLYRDRNSDGRLSITINHTAMLVNRVANNLKQQRPRIKCHPVGDGADVEKAQLVNGLTREIENRSHASVAYDLAAESALHIGWGYYRIVGEYVSPESFDQQLTIKPIRNVFTVYKDPGSVLPDGSDSMRYIISEKMKRIEYKQRYPQADNADFQDIGLGEGDLEWESKDEIRLAEYYRIIEKPERLFKMVNNTTKFESDFAPGVLKTALKDPQKHGFVLGADGEALERKSSKRQVEWYRINGREVIEHRDLPGEYIPIILCTGNVLDLNGKVRRKGMIEDMVEPARLVNYWESSKAERLALTSKAPWKAYAGVTAGHPEWDDANQKAYSVLIGNAIEGPGGALLPLPERQEPAQVEAGMTEASQESERQLLAIAGMPHEPGQDAKGEVVSGVALQQRRALADDTHYQYYDNETLSIAFGGRILFDLIPYYYDTEREQRIIGEDGTPSVIWINQLAQDEQGNPTKKNDLTIGRYDVVMDTGPGYDTKRQEGADTLMQLLNTPLGEIVAQKGADLVLRGLDTAYSEELADRLVIALPQELEKAVEGMSDRAKNIIKALNQQLTQVQQQLQSTEMDLKHGLTKTLHQEATKLQVEHLKDKRAEADTHTDAFTKIEDTHTRAQTAINVAEIRAGAEMLNTHVEAKYDEKAAKELAKNAVKAETNGAKAQR